MQEDVNIGEVNYQELNINLFYITITIIYCEKSVKYQKKNINSDL